MILKPGNIFYIWVNALFVCDSTKRILELILMYHLTGKKMKKLSILLSTALIAGLTSCNYLDVEPVGKVIPEKVTEYRALLTSAYNTSITYKKLLALRSDELFPALGTPTYDQYIDIALLNDVGAGPTTETYPLTTMYKIIFYANSVIDGVMEAEADTRADSREQLKAEALLLRAYIHFELLNLYARPYE